MLEKGRIIFDGDVESAIQHYMGMTEATTFPVDFDFTKTKRAYHFGKKIFVASARLLQKENAKYLTSEPIRLQIMMRSMINLPNAQIIVRIKDSNNTQKIAAALSEPFAIHENTDCSVTLQLASDILTADQYCISFEVISRDNTGNYYSYDNPYATIQILVENAENADIFWSTKYWGNVAIQKMPIIEFKES